MPPDHSPAAGREPGTLIRVVAAVIRDGDRYLLCQRPLSKRHGGLWEFPGGKMEAGESVSDAVSRELREELSVETTCVGELMAAHRDANSPYVIEFYSTEIRGEVACLEHQQVAWLTAPELQTASLAPSDRAFVARLIG